MTRYFSQVILRERRREAHAGRRKSGRGSLRRRFLLGAAILVVIVLGLVAAYVLHVRHEGRNIKGSSTVEFVPTVPKPAVQHPKPKPHARGPGISGRPTASTTPPAGGGRDRRHASVHDRLDVPRPQPGRVSARDRLRAALLRHQRGLPLRGRCQDRQAGLALHLAAAARRCRRPSTAASSSARS